MQRKFIINIVFLLSVNLLIKPFFIFGIDRGVQNEVGAAAYGLYFTLFNFSSLFQIVVDFGIQNFNNRNIAQHHHLLDKYFSHLSLLKVLLSVAYGVLVLLGAMLCGYTWTEIHLLLFIVINQILLSFILFFRSNISGLQEYFTDSLVSVLDRLLLIAVCGFLLWYNPFASPFRIEWFVYAQTLVYSLTALVAFGLVFRRLKTFFWHWNPAFQVSLLRGSLPYALSFFLMSVYTRLDTVMIERMLPDGAHEAGLYASAYRLLDASNMIGYLFASLLMPMFAKLIQEKTPVLSLARFSFQALWVAAATLAAACFVYREPIMHLLYTESNAYSADLLGWLMLSFPAVSTMYIFGCLLSANNTMRATNWIYAAGVVVNLGLNIVLIPQFKALGAAYATLFTQIIIGLGLVFVAQRTFAWRNDFVIVFKIFAFFVINYLIFWFLQNSTIFWLYGFVAGCFAALALAFALRLVDIKNLATLKLN
jgi:O-antigen/teichoic acid export membrane protein